MEKSEDFIIMSTEDDDAQAAATDMCCASCGNAEGDEVKLKTCAACKLVRYCSVKCQKEHRPQHKARCKERVAELHDEILFQQPESSHLGDCPICLLPQSLNHEDATMMTCCTKIICDGCKFANMVHEMEANLESKCPFCRKPEPKSKAECIQSRMKRIEKNDPVAIREHGTWCLEEKDFGGAITFMTQASNLGDAEAHYQISKVYRDGLVVEKDSKKEWRLLEKAAIGGHPAARHNLGAREGSKGRYERAKKHYIIAANLGQDDSIKALKQGYEMGFVSKEEFADALRAYQAAKDETNSSQREAAKDYLAKREGW